MRLTIEKLVYGGAGLARTDQGVVFVPRTAPGDVIEAELVDRKPDYATGRLTAILEPSPDRQTPYCPNYETAGCCHWQHIRYSRQLEIKEGILRETLRRTARIPWDKPIRIVSSPDRQYRMRASFHVKDRKLGFVEEGGHAVVPILECAALTPELNAFIPEANQILASPKMAGVREVDAISGPPVLASFGSNRIGSGPARITVAGFVFDLHPDTFFQSNRYLLTEFVKEVAAHAADAERVLDLYCGSGFFTIPLASKAREILALEWSRLSVEQARVNSRLNAVTNVEFFEGQVEETLKHSRTLHPDLIVMNPPRTGAGRNAAEQIAALEAGKLLYVSCNPTTLAREAAVFAKHGYALHDVTMLDQFPNTYHIEMIAEFSR